MKRKSIKTVKQEHQDPQSNAEPTQRPVKRVQVASDEDLLEIAANLDKRDQELRKREAAINRAARAAECERQRSQRLLLRALPHEIVSLRSTAKALNSLLGDCFTEADADEETFMVAVFSRQALYHVYAALRNALTSFDDLSAITEALAVMKLVLRMTHEFGRRCHRTSDHGMFTGSDALRFGTFGGKDATRHTYGQWMVFAYRQILMLACNPSLGVDDEEVGGLIKGIQGDLIEPSTGQRAKWCPSFINSGPPLVPDLHQLATVCGARLDNLLYSVGRNHLVQPSW